MVAPFIDATTLQDISDAMEGLRPDSCSVQTLTIVRDAGGAPTSVYTTSAWFDCRVDATNRQAIERQFGATVAQEADYSVALPRAAMGVVAPSSRIVVNRSAPITLEVVNVGDRDSHTAEVVVACKETR